MASILVVEDEKIVAADIRSTLTSLGYTVPGLVSSGEEAIPLVAQWQPDLVLMDIILGGQMDGVQAARLIRQRFGIPVVFLTAYADGDSLGRARDSEPFGYIVKPFTEKDLRSTIEIALYKHQVERRLAHEVNNPLTYVIGNLGFTIEELGALRTELLQEEARSPEVRARLVEKVSEAIAALTESQQGTERVHQLMTEVGPGAGFHVNSPACSSENLVPVLSAKSPELTRRGRVLVVDDEPIVGASIRRTLAQEHEVTVVSGGREALELIQSGEDFDLILSDVMMPEMSGIDFYHQLQRCLPESAARMVFLTGGAFTQGARKFLESVSNLRLEKPFDPDKLRQFVREHLR